MGRKTKRNENGRRLNDVDGSFLRRHWKAIVAFFMSLIATSAVEALAEKGFTLAIELGDGNAAVMMFIAGFLAIWSLEALLDNCNLKKSFMAALLTAMLMILGAMVDFLPLPLIYVAIVRIVLKVADINELWETLKELWAQKWAKEAAAVGTIATKVALADTSEYAYNKHIAEELHKQVQVREIDPELVEEIKKNEEELRKMLPKEIEIEFRTRK